MIGGGVLLMVKVRNDLTGQHVEGTRLTVLRQVEDTVRPCGKHFARYLVQCDCGSQPFEIDAGDIGRTKSCGCFADEVHTERCKQLGKMNKTHGNSGSRLYRIWANMKSRCYNPGSDRYDSYGARGITVCDEWRESYVEFEKWALLSGYNDLLTIDRINVNGNYEPSNCRWSTNVEQGNNKTNNIIVKYNGEKHTLSEWARITKINYNTLYYRLYVKHMSLDDVFSDIVLESDGFLTEQND